MQFIKPDINIDFIGKKKTAFFLSIIIIIVSIGSLVIKGGPKFGVDFAGGTLIQIKFFPIIVTLFILSLQIDYFRV